MNQFDSTPRQPSAVSTNGRWEHALPAKVTRSLRHWAGLLLFAVSCAAVVFSPPAARAASASPPGKVAYQGFLTDANGVPLGNDSPINTNVTFRIFSASIGGTLKWAEQQVVTVDKGHFSIFLGEGAQVGGEPFIADLTGIFGGPDASDRFIEITVGSTTIAPRLQFLPAPYAMLAANARNIVGPNGAPLADTSSGLLNVSGGMAVNGFGGSKINLYSSGDNNHYIGYNNAVNGPTVAGWNGGSLASVAGGYRDILQWSPAGVTVNGTLTMAGAGVPIQLPSTEGAKINLWSNVYGFGITPSTLTIFSGGDIALGLGGFNLPNGEMARFKANGNVGIGTANPGSKLHVIGQVRASGSGGTEGYIEMNPAYSDNRPGYIGWWRNSSTRLGYMGWDTYGAGNIGLVLENGANFLVGNGNFVANNSVGIGTAAPVGRLNISEANGTWAGPNSGTLVLDHENSGGASSLVFRSKVNRGSDFAYVQYQDNNGGTENSILSIVNQNDGDDHIALIPSGNLGVGTYSPAAKLHVSGGDARFDTGYGRTFEVLGYWTRMSHPNNKSKIVDWYRYDNGFAFSVYGGTSQGGGADRTVIYDGDSNWDFQSDRRLKTNIVDAESVLNRVMDIKMRRFRWIDGDPDKRPELGVIAQEFEPLFPELVGKFVPPKPNPLCPDHIYTVGLSSLGTIAIKAIQEVKQEKDREIAALKELNKEQGAKIASLREINNEQGTKIASLETEMSELKRLVARIAEAQKNNRPVAAADQAVPRVGAVAGR